MVRKPPKVATREDIQDAATVVEYLVHDLIVAHQLYDVFVNMSVVTGVVAAETEKAVRRMYVSYLVLTLQKFSEFTLRYKWLLPNDAQLRCEGVTRELRRRGIINLRHKFIGHIANKKTGRPISAAEIDAAFRAAVDNDLDGFLRWIHVAGNTASPDTVVGTLSRVHEGLRARLR